jgi:hypothetical protein
VEPYLFYGVVLPERAQLSIQHTCGFSHPTTGAKGIARVSIVLNQIAIWIDSEFDWDIFDLRNVVKTLVQDDLALIGYLKGYAYDFEITRVVCLSRQIDYVFGIDMPCIAERASDQSLEESIVNLRNKSIGRNGMLLKRCFTDLVAAMKHADDTGFYCYRAIESLRHHCAHEHGLASATKDIQWQKLRDVSGVNKQIIMGIKDSADPVRHGDVSFITGESRVALLTDTWNVVDSYLKNMSRS